MALGDPLVPLGANSGEYTPDVIARRQAIAQKLYLDSFKPKPIRNWLEGVGDLAQTAVAAYGMKKADETQTEGQRAIAQALLGTPSVASTAGPQANMQVLPPNNAPQTRDYVENEVSPLDPVAPGQGQLPVKIAALLNATRGDESGRYDATYGGGKINSFADHPRQAFPILSGPNAGRSTTAAGADQFLSSTWDQAQKATGVPDFSPQSQDKAAWWLASRDFKAKTGQDLETAITSAQGDPNKLQQIGRALSGTWTSLPGGIEQGRNAATFGNRLASQLGQQPVQTASLDPRAGVAHALGQTGDAGMAVPPPTPDRAAIAGALAAPQGPQGGLPPQGQMAQSPPISLAQNGPQMPPQIAQMLQHPNPYVQQRGIEMAQQWQQQQLKPPSFGAIGTDTYGNPVHGWINPNTQTTTPAGITAGQVPGQQSNAPNNPNVTGEEFLKTLDPGKAETVRGIAEGRIPYPSGFIMKTPYGQWLTQAVGQYEPGIDSTKIKERATFNTQMGSATPSSVGGQKNLMGTSLGHLGEVAEAAADLNNSNGFGIAPLAHLVNRGSQLTTEQAAKANKLNETVDRFSGEVGKLYSGSAGGGVQERDQTRSRFGAAQSPQELAAGLEASRDLIKSKLNALENQQDQIFGPNYKKRVDFLGDNGREALAKIETAIQKLKGNKPTESMKPTNSPVKWERKPDGSLGPVQ